MILASLLLCSVAGLLQDLPVGGAPPATLPATRLLSLEEAIAEAFANNLALKGALLQADAALQGFNASWGLFDTTFFAQVTRSEDVDPPTPTTFVGSLPVGGTPKSETDLFNLSTGFRGSFTTGTSWELNVFGQERETENRNKPVPFKSEVNAANWRLALTHPLLKGGGEAAMATVELAAKDVAIASLTAEITATATIGEVISAYWNLVFARQDVATRDLSVTLAAELLDITRRKFDQGLQNRIDVIEAEAELARRKEEQLTAANALAQAMDDLRKLVFAPGIHEEWHGVLEPSTDYAVLPGSVPTTDEAVTIALQRRPAIAQALARIERADLELMRAENEDDPRLDVTGQYGVNAQNRNLSLTGRDLDDPAHHNLSLSLAFELPLGNRGAGYSLQRLRIERERAAVAKTEAELTAIAEVRQASRSLALQSERVISTAETTRLRREVYEGEKRRLENDLSTPFQVRQAQRDLLEAIDVELRARLDLATAHTDYESAQGTLLERFGYGRRNLVPSTDAPPPAWDE